MKHMCWAIYLKKGTQIQTETNLRCSEFFFPTDFYYGDTFDSTISLNNGFHLNGQDKSMSKWQGAYMDSSAVKTVIGLYQAKAYFGYNNIPLKPLKSSCRFRFGPNQHKSVRSIPVQIPIRDEKMIIHRLDIVSLNISFLIGLDTLTKYQMYVDTLHDKLCLPNLIAETLLTKKNWHIYLVWPKTNLTFLARNL